VRNLSDQKVRWLIFGLGAVAAIRVFVFAAAFPFFNNVDEQAHVDLVVKYSHGNVRFTGHRNISFHRPNTADNIHRRTGSYRRRNGKKY
jgi:hypothetical protein